MEGGEEEARSRDGVENAHLCDRQAGKLRVALYCAAVAASARQSSTQNIMIIVLSECLVEAPYWLRLMYFYFSSRRPQSAALGTFSTP